MNKQAQKGDPRKGRWVIRTVAVTAASWAAMDLLSPLLAAVGDDPARLAQMSPLAAAGAYAAVLASVLALAGFVLSAVLLLAWEYRAIKAANALGVPTDLAPVEAIVWWFVPIANLWKPYTVMRSLGALAPGLTRTTAAWWASYLLTTAFVYLSNAGGMAAQVARFGGCATVLLAASLLARIVRGVQDGVDAAAAGGEDRQEDAKRVAF